MFPLDMDFKKTLSFSVKISIYFGSMDIEMETVHCTIRLIFKTCKRVTDFLRNIFFNLKL